MKCLFLAPLKSPDHPVASGDRVIARLWMRALARLGYTVELASRLRTYHTMATLATFPDLEHQAVEEARRILRDTALDRPPNLVFCYHNYFKAPDLIGPGLARALGVPYIVAEGSRAPKRLCGPQAEGERRADIGLSEARLLICASRRDRPALEAALKQGQTLIDLPAFIAPEDWPEAMVERRERTGAIRLITVAMMREGNKTESYRMLAAALAKLGRDDWRMDIFGDGPKRSEVEAAFHPLGSKVRFHGVQDTATLGQAYSSAELFVWPAVREPYGMVFLEAQLHGLPCLAGLFGGVEDAIAPGDAGNIVPDCTAERFAEALARLIAARERLPEQGRSARRFVLEERSLEQSLVILRKAFRKAGIPLPEGD
ncbi:glycosyltransferase family 4 protein [Rhabdaerophilum sp. SD176]|uniref:glycosyltransferase family 4 protein n=1 Tax=Rhabdaerophilum sp. SD176 TaxID=2983548 RepID=UPI0024DFF66E|nr:glycosyltransferase family 4 protein [Rhabdaerophilum sp. SD176]